MTGITSCNHKMEKLRLSYLNEMAAINGQAKKDLEEQKRLQEEYIDEEGCDPVGLKSIPFSHE